MIDDGTACAQRLVMAAAKRFEDLIVWQLSVAVRDAVYVLTGSGRASSDFAFRQQIRDAASSAPRNIAEGFQRYNPPQFAQFMNVAKGSLAETQNHLLHGKHQGYFAEQDFTDAWRLTCRALRAANRLHAYLRRCGKRHTEPRRTPSNPVEPRRTL